MSAVEWIVRLFILVAAMLCAFNVGVTLKDRHLPTRVPVMWFVMCVVLLLVATITT